MKRAGRIALPRRICARWSSREKSFLHPNPRDVDEHVFNINYFEYSGELATSGARSDIRPFQTQLQQSVGEVGVVIGIIDGQKLREYLTDRIPHPNYMHDNVRPIVERMKDHRGPVHFVITKWDLLDGYTIDELWQVLLRSRNTGFKDAVENRGKQARLIPVSSVGAFASPGAGGTMGKMADMTPEPKNVEIPLVAAVADICKLTEDHLRKEEQSARVGRRNSRWSALKRLISSGDVSPISVGPLSVPLKVVVAFAYGGSLAGQELGLQAAWLARSMRRQYRKVKARGLHGVTSYEGALFYVADVFRRRLLSPQAVDPD